LTETVDKNREHAERLKALVEAPEGTPLTSEDLAALKFVLEYAQSLWSDNSTFYTALLDIAYERNEINGKGRMARRAARALGDRAQ
jgi:hypothetical protein